MAVQDETRAKLQLHSDGPTLFPSTGVANMNHVDDLRRRYVARARRAVIDVLRGGGSVPYDGVYSVALAFPLVAKGDLAGWLKHWRDAGAIAFSGWTPRQRVWKIRNNEAIVVNDASRLTE